MGPVLSIVTPDVDVVSIFKGTLEQYSAKIENDDFWIGDEPFIYSIDKIGKGNSYYEDKDIYAFELNFRTKLCFDVIISAMCNSEIDHRILASFSRDFATACNGFINIQIGFSNLENIAGLYFDIRQYHFCDSKFLDYWIKDPSFYLVK